jgi:hypothetical protein
MKKLTKYILGIGAALGMVAVTIASVFAACPESGCASKAGYYYAMQQAAAQPTANPIVVMIVIAGIAYAAKWMVDRYA